MKNNALRAKLEGIIKGSGTGITTLKAQNSDSLDFHEVSVWDLEALLTKAYELGLREGQK